ncbi:MAG TPA: methyltransferase domain-containing protein [Burkholderiaceae bacterium]|nr:methyltransferase domain-containing protein [Burkholderiaceae bacterium]
MPLGPGTSELTPTMVAPPRIPARVATVRRQFDARAARFGQSATLPREIGRRLVERLQYIRLAPQCILDVGCGAAETRALLQVQYPRADWVGLDISERMLKAAATDGMRERAVNWLRGSVSHRVAGDAGRLPFADQSADLVFSNLMLHWHPEPHTVFPEWKRVLKTDGLLMFSCFGPDTLKELRAAAAVALPNFRAMPFVDMHDFGDMMVASGFATPVMDAEVITLTYSSPQQLLQEVRVLGGNPREDRAQWLPSGRQARQVLSALDAQRGDDGRIRLTFEVAYGHAWKPAPSAPRGVTAITLETLRAQLASRNPIGNRPRQVEV